MYFNQTQNESSRYGLYICDVYKHYFFVYIHALVITQNAKDAFASEGAVHNQVLIIFRKGKAFH